MDNNFRKAQTRTKIQLGGLLIKSGLADLLDIQSGDDLHDHLNRDKAHTLLGVLANAFDNLKSQSSLTHFLSKGKTIANLIK